MKGIILAGGSGTRLYPITKAISKQLMPIYDKPMIYYPLSTLMKAGVREILIITTPQDQQNFKNLLGDGSDLGCEFEYAIQDKPRGLADTYIVAEKYLKGESSLMVLGDNLFFGSDFEDALKEIRSTNDFVGGKIFGYWVSNPRRYGVLEIDDKNNVLSVEEKPENPKSNYAIPGIYLFDGKASEFAKKVKPSERGEIEIPAIMQQYLDINELQAFVLDRGTAWLDTGTFESMTAASQFVEVIEKRHGLKIGCVEEEAYRQGFITLKQLQTLAEPLIKSGYGEYLLSIK